MSELENAVKTVGESGITEDKGWMTANEFTFAFQAGVNSRAAIGRIMEVINHSPIDYCGEIVDQSKIEDAIRKEITAVQFEVWKALTGKDWND